MQRCVADEQTLKINTLFSEKVPDKSKYIYIYYIIHIHYIIIYDIILYIIIKVPFAYQIREKQATQIHPYISNVIN